MSYDNIPEQMRAMDKWVLWRNENRDGKPTKVPYAVTGGRASVTNTATWSSFNKAEAACSWEFDGIGFVLTSDDPFVIIDYDEECPGSVIDQFDTYIERSQSGRGVHIIMEGSFTGRKRKGHVECYQDQRYMIMTGDVVKARPIANCQDTLDKWRAANGLVEVQETKTTRAPIKLDDSLDDIRERMFAANHEIQDLYEHGHKGDKSKDDAQLLEACRFWAGGDKATAFALFEQSACVRDKWIKRSDYRERTWSFIDGGDVWTPQSDDCQWSEERVSVPLNFCERIESDLNVWKDDSMPMLDESQYNPRNMGALTEIVDMFNRTAAKPIPQFAMHTALSIVGTYLSRRFKTISGNYTSLYWGVIAPSGGGKGHTNYMINYVLKELDPALEALIEGSGYTSDSGIFNTLQRAPAHVIYLDELGDYIAGSRSHNNHTAQAQWRTLKEAWGNGGILRPKNYSDHTQRTKSNAQVYCCAPNITIFGGSTVSQFWSSLSIKDGADGFLNRWLIYTDTKKSPSSRRIRDLSGEPIPDALRSWHETMCKRSPINTVFADGESVPCVAGTATEMPDPIILDWEEGAEDMFYHYQVDVIEPIADDVFKYEMFQRAAQMARSIALIVELARNPWAEFVTVDSCAWSLRYVNTVVSQMVKYAKRNIAGNEEEALALKLLNAIRATGKHGLTKKQMQGFKFEEFTRRNFDEAIKRLEEGGLVARTNRTAGRGRPQLCWVAIESDE